MRSFMMFLRVAFLLGAIAVMISGGYWWVAQRRANATATAIKNLSAIAYAGQEPQSKKLATQLSSYKFKDEKIGEKEHKLFKEFTQAEEKKDPSTMKTVMRSMSKSYRDAGETELAVKIEKQSIDISKARKEHKDVAGSLQEIGDIYHKAANYDKSEEYDKLAVAEYQKIDAKKELHDVLTHLAKTYKQKGMVKEAKKTLKRAEKVVAGMHGKIQKQAKELGDTMTGGTKTALEIDGNSTSENSAPKQTFSAKKPAKSESKSPAKAADEGTEKTTAGDDETT